MLFCQLMPSAARISCRWPASSMFDVVGLRWRDSRAYTAIVATADFKILTFNASGAVEYKIRRSLLVADHAAAILSNNYFGRKWKCVIFKYYSSEELITLSPFTRLSPTGTHFTAESTEAMRIKSLAQGENILMLGFEPSTFCIQNRHSNHYTNCSQCW